MFFVVGFIVVRFFVVRFFVVRFLFSVLDQKKNERRDGRATRDLELEKNAAAPRPGRAPRGRHNAKCHCRSRANRTGSGDATPGERGLGGDATPRNVARRHPGGSKECQRLAEE